MIPCDITYPIEPSLTCHEWYALRIASQGQRHAACDLHTTCCVRLAMSQAAYVDDTAYSSKAIPTPTHALIYIHTYTIN